MDLETRSKRERLEIHIPITLRLRNVVAEEFYDALHRPLGLLAHLGELGKRKIVRNSQHGADSVNGLGQNLPSGIGENKCRGALRIL